MQCPVLCLQGITPRLCIRSLTEFTLCAIKIGLCLAQRIRCMTLGAGLARDRNRLACVTHFLYWRCCLATGEQQDKCQQPATPECAAPAVKGNHWKF